MTIASRVARARSDKIATMIATAAALGVEFIRTGDDLVLRGQEHLAPEDRTLLDGSLEQLRDRLIGTAEGDPYEILDTLDIDLEEVADTEHARTVIAALPPTIGLDLETCARPEYQPPRRPLVITKGGMLRAHQPKANDDRLGLDPIRGRVRIVSVFDPGAGVDSAIGYRATVALRDRLDASALPAFKLQSGSARATARMRLRGLPFNVETHRATIERWQGERDQAHQAFIEVTGAEPPGHPRALAAWLEERLDPVILATLDRTPTGQLSTKADTLERLAYLPEIRPLMRLRWADHRLNAFGESLLKAVHPVDGRIRADFMHCAAKSGRLRCRAPNVQQLEEDSRHAIEAPAGSLLVWADLSQIEARVEGELAPDPELRAVFAEGRCVHCITAAATHGVPEDAIAREGDPRRDAAKPIVYGVIYGAGPATLAATAFKKYHIEMSLEEARHAKNAFLTRFPGVAEYQVRMSEEPIVYSITGRPLRPEWETRGEVSYCQRVNFPTQSSAGDILLNAMILVDRYLPDTMILSLHDELVLEVSEDEVEQVEEVLADIMPDACLRWFPNMPTRDLVKVKHGRVWS